MTVITAERADATTAAVREIFTQHRTANSFADIPVSPETLREIYEVVKFGPTAANSQPMRIVYVTSEAGKSRLLPLMSDGNRAKTGQAPAVAIVGADADFHEHMPEVFPHAPESRDWFGDLDARRAVSRFNTGIQLGYFISVIRGFGLAAGPQTCFDHDGIDAEFFPDSNTHAIAVVNIGHPGDDPWQERLPRRSFDDVVEIV